MIMTQTLCTYVR